MVPKGWVTKCLSEIVREKISYGIVQAGPHMEDGVPYIKSSDVRGAIEPDNLQKTSQTIHFKYRRSSVHPGDIVFSLRGNIGQCAIVPNSLPEANLTQGTARIAVDDSQYNYFHYYQLTSDQIIKRINALSKGSTFKEISLEELRKIKVLCPTFAEQKKIAQILLSWDEAITACEALLFNSQQQNKALMQKLLTGKIRFPGFSDEWVFKSISEISNRIQRKSDGAIHPILTISSLSGFVRQDERYSRYMAGESIKNYILLKKGEFAYNKGNSKTYEFGCIFDLENYETGLVPHVYVCFKLKDGFSHRYFKYLFESDYLKDQLGKLVNTGVRNNGLLNIKPSEFMMTKVPVPKLAEQEAIADILHASSQKIKLLKSKIILLQQEKKALMQQLLTGRRRVKVDAA